MLQTIATFLFPLALLYAGTRDLMSYEIPNWVSLAMIAAFLVAAFAGSFRLADIGWHLAAGAAVLVVGFILFAAKVLGGGDVKLLAACAVWIGWMGLLKFFMFVALVGVYSRSLSLFFGGLPCPTLGRRDPGFGGFTTKRAAFPMVSRSDWAGF